MGATSYDVYRNGSLYFAGVTGTSFLNTLVTPGTTYSYFVRPKNSYGTTTSNTVAATAKTCGSVPGPLTLSATPECNGNLSQIRLNWTASVGATSYDVYRNGSLYYAGVTGTSFLNTLVTPGTTYAYFVQAKNSYGTTNSNTVAATAKICNRAEITWGLSTNGWLEGWTYTNASSVTITDGIFYSDPSGTDHYISGPSVSADATLYRDVKLR